MGVGFVVVQLFEWKAKTFQLEFQRLRLAVLHHHRFSHGPRRWSDWRSCWPSLSGRFSAISGRSAAHPCRSVRSIGISSTQYGSPCSSRSTSRHVLDSYGTRRHSDGRALAAESRRPGSPGLDFSCSLRPSFGVPAGREFHHRQPGLLSGRRTPVRSAGADQLGLADTPRHRSDRDRCRGRRRSWSPTQCCDVRPAVDSAEMLLQLGEGRTRFLALWGLIIGIRFLGAILYDIVPLLVVPYVDEQIQPWLWRRYALRCRRCGVDRCCLARSAQHGSDLRAYAPAPAADNRRTAFVRGGPTLAHRAAIRCAESASAE